MLLSLVWISAIVLAIVVYLREVYSRFSKHGVAYIKPAPFIGNVGGVALRKYHLAEDVQNLYQMFPNERFMGRFEMLKPVLVIRDLELIKQITVKDYEYFLDHRTMVDDTVDPIFGRNLFSLKGQEWKDMRSTLSPAFTSSKMKAMVPFMVDANHQMIRVLQKRIDESETGYIDIDCKDLLSRYTNDVIATCAFGIKVDSHTDTHNEFYIHGKASAGFGFRRMLVYLGYCSFPSLMKKLNLKFFTDDTADFFKGLFINTILDRETKNIFRPDMIQLLMQAKKGKLLTHDEKSRSDDTGFATVEESDIGKRHVNRSWSDDDLVAQAVLFFVAGFDTVSSAMCFLLHELAINPEVQERLVREIREYDVLNGGKFDYASIQNMKYLDMVISEALRLWPPAIGLDRICLKDYNVGKPNAEAKKDFIIRKGEAVNIPVFALHRDPAYFKNPEKFDPDRFFDENKHKINPFTYLPFGSGPRNCIGSRFALCEVKVMTYQLLLHVSLSPCDKTMIPARLSPNAFTTSIDGGHWIRLQRRK